MKKFKIIYDSDLCGTEYVDELYLSDSQNVYDFVDAEMYLDEMDIPDDVEISIQILSENDPEFGDY